MAHPWQDWLIGFMIGGAIIFIVWLPKPLRNVRQSYGAALNDYKHHKQPIRRDKYSGRPLEENNP